MQGTWNAPGGILRHCCLQAPPGGSFPTVRCQMLQQSSPEICAICDHGGHNHWIHQDQKNCKKIGRNFLLGYYPLFTHSLARVHARTHYTTLHYTHYTTLHYTTHRAQDKVRICVFTHWSGGKTLNFNNMLIHYALFNMHFMLIPSTIIVKYAMIKTIHVLVVSFPCQPCYILNIWARGLFLLSIYSTRDRSCCMSSTSWKPSPLGKFYLLIITTLTTRWHCCTVVKHYKPIFASTFFRRCQPIKANYWISLKQPNVTCVQVSWLVVKYSTLVEHG